MMADSRELLAMFTPKGVDATKVPGGKPKLTAMDVAGAMGMGRISRKKALLLLVKYCDERQLKPELWSVWFRHVMAKAKRDKWDTEIGQLGFLANHSLDECIGTNVCSACQGTKEAVIDQKVVVCPVCKGSGKRYTSERRLAAGFAVSRRQYQQVWAPRVAWGHLTLQGWEASGAKIVSDRIS